MYNSPFTLQVVLSSSLCNPAIFQIPAPTFLFLHFLFDFLYFSNSDLSDAKAMNFNTIMKMPPLLVSKLLILLFLFLGCDLLLLLLPSGCIAAINNAGCKDQSAPCIDLFLFQQGEIENLAYGWVGHCCVKGGCGECCLHIDGSCL